MKILVSGASGFVGQHLLPKLSQAGHQLIGLTHSRTPDYSSPELKYHKLDLQHREEVHALVEELKPDMVIDLAAVIDYSTKRRSQTINTNIDMTANLVNASLSIGAQYLKMSSIAALGDPLIVTDTIDEKTPWDYDKKHSAYAEAKKYSELEVWRGYAEGLEVMVLYPGVILGVGDSDSISHSFSKTVTKPQKFYTPGVSLYVDVLDLCHIILSLVQNWKNGESYIVGRHNISFEKLLNTAADTLGYRRPQYLLRPWMSSAYRVLFNLKQRLKGEDGFVSKANMQSLYTQSFYNSQKLLTQYPQTKYAPLELSLRRIHTELQNQ